MTQSDIINNNFSKAFECIKCSNAYDTGEVLSEEKLFKQISERKHSTFDLSKFTVVGSPTITDDGVASGFSVANNLVTPPIDFSKPFEIIFSEISNGKLAGIIDTNLLINLQGFGTGTSGNKGYYVRMKLGSNTPVGQGFMEVPFDTKVYAIKFVWDGNKYYLYSKESEKSEWIERFNYNSTVCPSDVSGNSITRLIIGYNSNSDYSSDGYYDLKQFSITVDGKGVFSGNKTGIDTIKADNYNVVGSPVISDDGVAIFDTSSALSTGVLGLDGTKDWDIYFDFNNTGATTIPISTVGANKYHLQIGCGRNNGVFLQIGNANGGAWGYNSQWIANVLSAGLNKVHYKYKASETKYFIYINDMLKFSIVNSNTVNDNYNMLIGNATSLNSPVTQGFDLNSLKIYQEGNLIYQPCLKIPYTQSKTGSKIVDVAYRDRVIDLYEQEGQAGYYTIDEENKNFTLPMGEIYGMIEDTRDSIPTKISQLTDDSTFVHKTGNETVAGVKTFSSNPIITGTGININNSNDVVIQKQGTNFLRKASNGGIVLSGTNTIYFRPNGDTNGTGQLSIAKDGTVTGTKFVGSLKGNVTGNVSGSSGSCTGNSATATKLNSRGNQTAITAKEESGLYMHNVYNNGYPCSYGNVVTAGGLGGGQLIMGWSGVNKGIEHLYYRNRRDAITNWSDWRTIAFTTDNVASATKATQDSNGNVITSTYLKKTEAAEQLASKVDTSSLVECQVVINTYVNGTSGYRIWSDGYCEQWGRGALNEVATTTITLLKAYKDTNYSVSAVSITASTAQDTEAGLQCTPISATQITLTAHYINPNNQTACWETKGYLAEGEY